MKRPRRNRPLVVALYTNAALLLAILLAVFFHGSSGGFLPSASAAPVPAPIAGNGNLYVMPAQLLNNVWGCYILDIEHQTLCTYSYSGNQLLLKSARSIRYDHDLEYYNTSPDPDEIRKLVALNKGRVHAGPQQVPPEAQPGSGPDSTPPTQDIKPQDNK